MTDDLYSYSELLDLIYGKKKAQGQLVLKSPALIQADRQVRWINFSQLCASLQRKEKHVARYVLNALEATGHQDLDHALVIYSEPSSSELEQMIRRYALEYVICTCRSFNTRLYKEKDQTYLSCLDCHSQRRVN